MEHRGRPNAPNCSLNRLAVGHVEILPRVSKALALWGGKPHTGPAEKTSRTGYQEDSFSGIRGRTVSPRTRAKLA